jgi:hypothetical protein
MSPVSVNEGLYRVGGMYGAAYRDSKLLAEVVEVTVAVEINRIEVPLTGSTKQGYKPGRETREGTINVQKIDSAWELEVYNFLSQSLADRRALRGSAGGALRPFSLLLEYDDPDALGYEAWQLDGCLLWRMQLGFAITDDIVNREFPLTWETERPVSAFKRTGAISEVTKLPAITYPFSLSP